MRVFFCAAALLFLTIAAAAGGGGGGGGGGELRIWDWYVTNTGIQTLYIVREKIPYYKWRVTKNTQNTWPFGQHDGETSIQINQRMIHHLLAYKSQQSALTDEERRNIMAIGIELLERRDEAGLSRKEATLQSGLDSGFLCILEAGADSISSIMVMPYDLTNDVMDALKKVG